MKRKKALQVLAVAALTGTLALGQILPGSPVLPTERVETEKEQPARQAKNTADTEENTAAKAVADVAKNDAAKSKNTQEKKTSTEETDKKDKEETVYVKADADGTPNKITVETVLRAPENGEKIADVSTLSDIRNTEGDEEFTKDADGVLWWENKGEDIQYKGAAQAALPVQVHIQYFLDEKEIAPEELAGKSGHLRMRFTYDNQEKRTVSVDGKQREVCVPFAAMSTCLLPTDVFSHVEVTNGKLISMGDQNLAVGTAFPGLEESLKLADYEPTEDVDLPDYVEISADVKDFELSFTATIVTPGLFSEIEDSDLSDADDLTDSMKELMDATDELVDGTDALHEGAQTFQDYMGQYLDGIRQLNDGTAQLQQGVSLLNEKKTDLVNGAKGLAEGLKALDTALQGLDLSGETGGENAGASEAAQAKEALTAALGALSANTSTLTTLLNEITLPDEASLNAQATEKAQAAAREAFAGALADSGLSEEDLAAVQGALETSVSNISIDGLSVGGSWDADGIAQASAGIQTSLATISAYVQQLQESMGGDSGLTEQLAALKQSVSQLAAGSEALSQGVTAFGEGIGQLSQGTEALTKGTGMLVEAGDQLYDGFGELTDGTEELADGMKMYNEDGIQELGKLAGSDLKEVLTRMKALREADGQYDNYAGIADGSTGSVRFIIETEEIALP